MYSKLVNFARVKVKKRGIRAVFLRENVHMHEKVGFAISFTAKM